MPVHSIKSGHGEKRSRKQELAVLALLTEPNFEVAADKVGVSKSTLWRWMQTEDFQEQYREAKRLAVGQAISRLQQATTTAVDTLEAVMIDVEAPAMARVLASKTVLDTAFKAIETEDIQARLRALERMSAND